MKITETNLADQLKRKNTRALDYLIDNYSNLLYKVIYNVLINYGDKGVIEECLNDVLLSIWNNSSMFSGKPEKFVHWICVIAKYKAIDYQRKLAKNKKTVDIDDCVIITGLTTEDKVLADENQMELLGYINEMEELDKRIFIMRFYLEENISDIAVKLGVSRNVVDTRLSRGKKLLKQKLGYHQKEENGDEKCIQAF
ncbi:sigma-70 family RNA polymerase sigma factor [Clostridium polynesiense]|uniref:sigma-70 family RNA polymerase sigma factor n=1 Tax=Clostridium polynesiense TaxID=1325933 RepID=UPI000694053B|nr:sigma-70 family RNA polymerase sigma factor [Clostridium polynesiense]